MRLSGLAGGSLGRRVCAGAALLPLRSHPHRAPSTTPPTPSPRLLPRACRHQILGIVVDREPVTARKVAGILLATASILILSLEEEAEAEIAAEEAG